MHSRGSHPYVHLGRNKKESRAARRQDHPGGHFSDTPDRCQMVMRLNPTELCSYAIAALIVIATITVATWIVMTVWSSAPL